MARAAFPRVAYDETHQQAWTIRPDQARLMNDQNPDDASLVGSADRLTRAGLRVRAITGGSLIDELENVDVLVVAHPSDPRWEKTVGTGLSTFSGDEIDAIVAHVEHGGGLVVLAEHEQDKYGNNVNELLARFGLGVSNVTVTDVSRSFSGVAAWVRPVLNQPGRGVLSKVDEIVMYRGGTIIGDGLSAATVVAASGPQASPAQAPMLVTMEHGHGRVVVAADSDLFGDDSLADADHGQLWTNLVTWASLGRTKGQDSPNGAEMPPVWEELKQAVEAIRPLQAADGSISDDHATAGVLVDRIVNAIDELAPLFPHQREQLSATVTDFRRWVQGGFAVPDFLDSLQLFRPELDRTDGRQHLFVAAMYTQNGNPNRNIEAVWCATVWPKFVQETEAGGYENPAFVPIRFVDFTSGYDTNSAVLFPETVSVRETPTFHWGAIFCDREAARFQLVSTEAARLLKIDLPADARLLLTNPVVARETFVLWDLVHDRTHSHGDLPFDPFMIKQRMPFWMYALEELRCDLNTYVESFALEAAGVPHARLVRYAILFDRLFRFPVTGDRVKNYDGLGGQILFGHLHRTGALRWTDNTLRLDWDAIDVAVRDLWTDVYSLYRSGIDLSRVGYWKAGYDFVASVVAANPGSKWTSGIDLGGTKKELVDAVLPDEFPLNVFYEALRTKLADTIEQTRGIR